MKRSIYSTWCGILIASLCAGGASVVGQLYGQATQRNERQAIETQVVIRRPTGTTTLQRVRADQPTLGSEAASKSGVNGSAAIESDKLPCVLSVSCTVYDRRISWIRWSVEGRKYSGFVNVDLGVLGHVQRFAHNGEAYALHMAVGNDSKSALQERNARAIDAGVKGGVRELPNAAPLSDGGLQLILENTDVANEQVKKDCRAIRDMLGYLEANHVRLREEQAAMSVAQSQETTKVDATARTTQNSVIKFWKISPKKSVDSRDSKN